jgi:hypothetical protein
MRTKFGVVVGCLGSLATFGPASHEVGHAAAGQPSEIATVGTLDTLGRGGVALAIDEGGTSIARSLALWRAAAMRMLRGLRRTSVCGRG